MYQKKTELLQTEKRIKARIIERRYRDRNRERIKVQRRKIYYDSHGAKLAYRSGWRRANPDQAAAIAQRYAAKYPDRLTASQKKYNQTEKSKAADRLWYSKNRDRAAASVRRWQAANKDKVRRASKKGNQRQRAIKLRAPLGNLRLIKLWEDSWRARDFSICFWCRSEFETANCASDHIVALVNGGAHSVENLCVSCKWCNSKKRSKSVARWNGNLAEPILL